MDHIALCSMDSGEAQGKCQVRLTLWQEFAMNIRSDCAGCGIELKDVVLSKFQGGVVLKTTLGSCVRIGEQIDWWTEQHVADLLTLPSQNKSNPDQVTFNTLQEIAAGGTTGEFFVKGTLQHKAFHSFPARKYCNRTLTAVAAERPWLCNF